MSQEEQNGPAVIRMTPRVLEESYLPALQEVAQNPYGGKVAYAVLKNYRYATRLARKIEKYRLDLVHKHAQKDEKGAIKTTTSPEGRVVAELTDEGRQAFDAEIQAYYNESLHDLQVHRASEQEIIGMNTVRPATLIMLAPMFEADPEDVQKDPPPMSVVPDDLPEIPRSAQDEENAPQKAYPEHIPAPDDDFELID
jgi:hypothetical protein